MAKRLIVTIASALLAVEVLAFAFYSAVNPHWLRPIMRSEYLFMWRWANWLTGNDFPPPDRFK